MKVSQKAPAASTAHSLSVNVPSHSSQRLSRQTRAGHLFAHEIQIRPHFIITRRQQFRPPIRGDGAAQLSQLEFRVAVIEPQRRRNRAGLQNFFVSGGRGGKFAFGVKFVRRVEIGGDIRRKKVSGARTNANSKMKILQQPT